MLDHCGRALKAPNVTGKYEYVLIHPSQNEMLLESPGIKKLLQDWLNAGGQLSAESQKVKGGQKLKG